VADPRGLCPIGWHVPTDLDWYILENKIDQTVNDPNFIGTRGTDAGGKLKAVSSLWTSPNLGVSNASGFTALPGACRSHIGNYAYIGDNGRWWSSTENSAETAFNRSLYHEIAGSYRGSNFKTYGLSVRCLKD
jgi:uncharacterized protein (TIGR02145 family)